MFDDIDVSDGDADVSACAADGRRIDDESWADLLVKVGLRERRYGTVADSSDESDPEGADGSFWAACPADAMLLDALLASEPVAADGSFASADALERLVGFDRVISAAQGHQLREIAALVERTQADPMGCGGTSEVYDHVAASVAAILRIAPATAAGRVQTACGLAERLPATLDALCEGAVLLGHACALLEETVHLDRDQLREVEAAMLAGAGRWTPGRLRTETRRAVAALDPELMRARYEAKRKERSVHLDPAPDGMAFLSASLTATDAEAVYGVIDAHARRDTEPGDERGIDARRADALVDLILNPAGPRPHVSTEIRVVVPVGTLLGLGEEPGFIPGYGPIPSDLARRIAADATWRRILTDPADGEVLDLGTKRYRPSERLVERVRTRDGVCRFPSCARKARYTDLDHVEPHRPDGSGGATADKNLMCLCRRHHRVKHLPGWSTDLLPGGTVRWTTPTGHTYRTEPQGLPRPG